MPKRVKKDKDDEKKSNRKINEKGSTATQEFDYAKFQTMFDKWKKECEASGEAIGMKADSSLFEVISNHGVVARPYTKNKLNRDEGAVTIIDMLTEWENDATVLETVDIKALDKVIEKLGTMADSKADPRNIKFTIPKPGEVDEDSGVYDDKNDVTEIHGHYRTQDYIDYRNILADIEGSKVSAESGEPANDNWYSEAPNEATPPMWQALFAGKAGKGDVVSLGLLEICQEAKKLTKGIKLKHVILEVDDDNQGLLAEDVYKIPSVQAWIKQQTGTAGTIGPGINPNTMHWKDRPMWNEIKGQKFAVKGLSQSNFIKDASDFDKYAGTIETFGLKISRRQTRKLATLTGVCEKYPTRDVVYHKGGKQKLDKKSKKPDKKLDKKVKKSWRETLSVV
tara:strand:+ start:61 stop:1245 length:1185 start_codon:yes stop_codon:yes gene_type:complete